MEEKELSPEYMEKIWAGAPDRGGKIGIVGGTFDPVHYGHLLIGEEARERFDLDQIVFIPAGRPPHKDGVRVLGATPQERRDMLLLAIQDHPNFYQWDYELQKEGPSYTVETMALLERMLPGRRFYFIMGKDSLDDIFDWKSPGAFFRSCDIIVCSRDGQPDETIEKVKEWSMEACIHPLYLPEVPYSSTSIRRRIAKRTSVRYMMPQAVVDYIEKNSLYRDSRGEG